MSEEKKITLCQVDAGAQPEHGFAGLSIVVETTSIEEPSAATVTVTFNRDGSTASMKLIEYIALAQGEHSVHRGIIQAIRSLDQGTDQLSEDSAGPDGGVALDLDPQKSGE